MISTTYTLAGNATFTVGNPHGTHYTYRINRKEGDKGAVYFASLLTGPDNEGDYTYLGIVVPETGAVRLTRASRLTEDSTPVQVLKWALGKIWKGATVPAGYTIQHCGHCGRCGRTLTVPGSIESGIGPECTRKMGAA